MAFGDPPQRGLDVDVITRNGPALRRLSGRHAGLALVAQLTLFIFGAAELLIVDPRTEAVVAALPLDGGDDWAEASAETGACRLNRPGIAGGLVI